MEAATGSTSGAVQISQDTTPQHLARSTIALFGTESPSAHALLPHQTARCSASALSTGAPLQSDEVTFSTTNGDESPLLVFDGSQARLTSTETRCKPSQLPYLARKVAHALRRASRMQDEVLQSRSQLGFEQQNLKHARRFQCESLEACMSALEEVVRNRSAELQYKRLLELSARCQDDYTRVNSQTDRVADLQSDMSSKEYRLMNQEQRCISLIQEFSTYFENESLELGSSDDDASSDQASSVVPSLLQKYYDRKGDVGIYYERLDELYESYLKAKEARDFSVDRGDTFERTEDEVEHSYLIQRQAILAELVAAESDAAGFEQACADAGIEFDEKRSMSTEEDDTCDELGCSYNIRRTLKLSRVSGCAEGTNGHFPTSDLHPSAQWIDRNATGQTNFSISQWLNDLVDKDEELTSDPVSELANMTSHCTHRSRPPFFNTDRGHSSAPVSPHWLNLPRQTRSRSCTS